MLFGGVNMSAVSTSYRFVVWDSETTGRDPRGTFKRKSGVSSKDKITEIGAYCMERGKYFQTIVNPGKAIPPFIARLTHIYNDVAREAPDFSTQGLEFRNWCQDGLRRGKRVVLISHNGQRFDDIFLDEHCKDEGVEYFDFYRLDTLTLFRREFPDLPRHALGFLKEHFKIINEGTSHRALEDAYVLRRVIEAGAKEKRKRFCS